MADSTRPRGLPTVVTIPIDPEFVPQFIAGGWQRVERMWGKRRTATWASAIGRRKLIAMRREAMAAKRAGKTE